ncbi:hypothetical protein [Paraburkholderia haematera]|nr:hypothetical protein [Paraburkholderia haematera]
MVEPYGAAGDPEAGDPEAGYPAANQPIIKANGMMMASLTRLSQPTKRP